MEHKPATPLPWEVDEEATVCANNTVVAFTSTRVSAYQDEDAGYIAHAANAYPKLIAELRKIVVPDDEGWTIIAGKSAASALALLRELGEIE